MAGRLAKRRITCRFGCRSVVRRNRITDGFFSCRRSIGFQSQYRLKLTLCPRQQHEQRSFHHLPIAADNPEHAQHHVPPDAILQLLREKGRYLSGTSRNRYQRQLSLAHRFSGVKQGFPNVLRFQIRICFKDLLLRHPVCYHGNDRCYRDT